MLRVLVVGCGSIGRRHLANLSSLSVVEISATDPSEPRRRKASEETGATTFPTLEDALATQPDAVFVATPTHMHVEHALAAAQAGAHLFIEKPLSHSLEGVEELAYVCDKKELITMVGCNMRFHHGPSTLKRIAEDGVLGDLVSGAFHFGQYLPDWRPQQDYRLTYSARQAEGGGIVLDGIHELDAARWLMGDIQQIFCLGGKRSSLKIDVEDCVDMLADHGGRASHVHLDYIQPRYSRFYQLVGLEGTATWDLVEGRVDVSSRGREPTRYEAPTGYTLNQMYVDEVEHFIDRVTTRARTAQDVRAGAAILSVALAAKRSLL